MCCYVWWDWKLCHCQLVKNLCAVTGISLERICGVCSNNMATIASFGLRVTSGRFVVLINPSNYNGSAALEVVTNLRSVSGNRLCVNSALTGSITPGSESVTVMFRGCTLCPRVAMCSGVTFNLGLHGFSGRRVGEEIRRTTEVLNVRRCLSEGPGTLSNNRERHITLNHTVIHGPGMFLLSRPLSGLSTGLHTRVEARVSGVCRHLNAAFVCMARSRARTVAVNAEVIIVGSNFVRRISAPRRLCSVPYGVFITKFVNSPRVGFVGTILSGGNNGCALSFSGCRIPIPRSGIGTSLSGCINGRIILNVHPRRIRSRPRRVTGTRYLLGTGISIARLVNTRVCLCMGVGNAPVATHIRPASATGPNSSVRVTFSLDGLRVFSGSARGAVAG